MGVIIAVCIFLLAGLLIYMDHQDQLELQRLRFANEEKRRLAAHRVKKLRKGLKPLSEEEQIAYHKQWSDAANE